LLRQKWIYVAGGVLISFVGLLLMNLRITELTERVQKLERYLPYLEPVAK